MQPVASTGGGDQEHSGSLDDLSRELNEAREQQRATTEILSVISRSPTDVQPVFDAIVANAARLCDAAFSAVVQFRDGLLHLVAVNKMSAKETAAYHTVYPRSPNRGFIIGRAFVDGRPVQVADIENDPLYDPQTLRILKAAAPYRTYLGIPIMRDGVPIGAIGCGRREVKPFSDAQIALVKTFADQAVIAIENARLFEAEQASKRELQESLEYQTAISNVLGVISRSPSDLQPVLDTIVRTASSLCEAESSGFAMPHDGGFRSVASDIPEGPYKNFLRGRLFPVTRGSVIGRAAHEKRLVHVPDVLADPDFTEFENQRMGGARTVLAAPLIKDDRVIGVISMMRRVVRPFSERQVKLLQTFADQAVIAIENTRLFEAEQASKLELQEALQYQTATSEVLNVISRSPTDAQPVFESIVWSAARLFEPWSANISILRDGMFHFEATASTKEQDAKIIVERMRTVYPVPFDPIAVPSARAIVDRRIIELLDTASPQTPEFSNRVQAVTGFRSMTFVPLLREGTGIGTIILTNRELGHRLTAKQRALVQTFADQAVIAIENARLFEEITRKSRELEIASQHKSQFVANMSHELRTPLAAILGYAELMQEGFYESQGPKSLDALIRIRSNGKHLLGLINTVLDIAKIESGQFTLNVTEYALESVVETVRSATESLAQNKKLSLKTEVAKSLPIGLGDEQRLTQVLLNLVGNAIKFTDTGEVHVTAKAFNGRFNVSVTDTGPGIAEHERTRIFEQFHQVDSSLTKAAGGTGLGLAIAKQIVEMHGGRIWVESTVGKGSTFHMEIPTRAEFHPS